MVLCLSVERRLVGLVCGGVRKSQGFAVRLATARSACVCCVGAAAIKLYLSGVSQLAGWEVTIRGCERRVRTSPEVWGLAAWAKCHSLFLVRYLKAVYQLRASVNAGRSAVNRAL